MASRSNPASSLQIIRFFILGATSQKYSPGSRRRNRKLGSTSVDTVNPSAQEGSRVQTGLRADSSNSGVGFGGIRLGNNCLKRYPGAACCGARLSRLTSSKVRAETVVVTRQQTRRRTPGIHEFI